MTENEAGYNRDLFHYPTDADHDHCDTRAEVLIRDTTAPVNATPGCTIVSGQWSSAYDGQTVTNAADIEIDHVVALKEAWDSGALPGMTPGGPRSATTSPTPAHWLPSPHHPTRPKATATRRTGCRHWCRISARYVGNWIAIKARWGLSMDQSEHDRIHNLLEGQCLGLTVPPITPAPASL